MRSRAIYDAFCEVNLDDLGVVELEFLRDEHSRVFLKREWADPLGDDPLRSIKRKPACLLFRDLLEKEQVRPGHVLISATSGNFGLEVGMLAKQHGIPFVAVVPAAIPEYNLRIIRALGIDLIRTNEYDTCPREFTVFFTRAYAHEYGQRLVNVDQYYSYLNPLAHLAKTAPEIYQNVQGRVDYIVASVGSCGTLSGLAQYVVATGRSAVVVGAQPAVNQGVPGTHVITGECKWSPENFSPVLVPRRRIHTVDQVDSFGYAAKLWAEGFEAGPSTGMALAQVQRMRSAGASGTFVIISPDSNFKYGDLIADRLEALSDEILARHPTLDLEDVLPRYIARMRQERGLTWMEARVREAYGDGPLGQQYGAEDIEEIVMGKVPLTSEARAR